MWTGPAPMRPYNSLVHPRSWRAFMEYGNGIVGDMCVHMLDMVRWMLDLGMPRRISSTGGILIDKASKANITDTQTATFDFGNLQVVWTHRSYGDAPDPEVSVGGDVLRRQGHAESQRHELRLHPLRQGNGEPIHEDVTYELDQFPEDKTEKDLEKHVAPAIRGHMKDFLRCIESRQQAGRGHRAGLHLGDRVHPGQSLDEARAVAAVGSCARGSSSATRKPIGCCAVRIARRGCTRSLARSDSPPEPAIR